MSLWEDVSESGPCSCGDAQCWGECPECGVHYPYEHTAECRIEEMEEVLDLCAKHGVVVDQMYVDDLLDRTVRNCLPDSGVYL